MTHKTKKYKKEFNYSYTLGAFPTLELITQFPDKTLIIYISSNSSENEGVKKIIDFCNLQNIEWQENDKIINKLSKKENVYAIGVFEKFEKLLEYQEPHLMLVTPSNSGNLGTIIRTMLAFNFRNLVIIEPAVDIFSPEVIRASMGAIFKINFEVKKNLDEYQQKHTNELYSFMTDGKQELGKTKLKYPFTLVFGNEGKGLPDNYKQFGHTVRIPQSDMVDSLNLAISVGVALWEVGK